MEIGRQTLNIGEEALREIRQVISKEEGIVEPRQSRGKSLSNTELDERIQKFLDMLSPLEPQKRHQDVRATRLDNTCTWLLEDERYRRWWGSSTALGYDRVLCCYGIPGAGKTVIRFLAILLLCYKSGQWITEL